MSDDDVKMSVRVPDKVNKALKTLARTDGRTLQGYVVRVLSDHAKRKGALAEAEETP